ncbi:MAG: HU family DNA-binding protein [Muribaculaceae bacterium]|nr:HU family DNA-binding protein [Muribaculaceae bacterium]
MDYKSFKKRLSEVTARSEADVDALVDALAVVIREAATALDSVAVPTFGTFVPVKHNEEVVTDLSTGKRMLVPPEITLEFQPGAMLRKKLRTE